jgi:hypothetical protein
MPSPFSMPEAVYVSVCFCSYPGVKGTAAVVAGYFLHQDPLHLFHWNVADALFGLKVAVPMFLLGGCLLGCTPLRRCMLCCLSPACSVISRLATCIRVCIVDAL